MTTITPTELSCLSGVTSNIQDQLTNKASLTGSNIFSASNTFNGDITASGLHNNFNNNIYFKNNIYFSGNTSSKTLFQNGSELKFETGSQISANNLTITPDQLSYLAGVSSNIQVQLGDKLNLTGGTISGNLTISGTTTLNSQVNFNNNILLNTLNSYIQFPDNTKQYTAAYGNISSISSGSAVRTPTSPNYFTIFSSLNTNFTYHFNGYIFISFNGGGGGDGGNIEYDIEFQGQSDILISRITDSCRNFTYSALNIPYSFTTTGIDILFVKITTSNTSDGDWDNVGHSHSRYVRI